MASRWWQRSESAYATLVLFVLTLGPLYQLRVRFGGRLYAPDLIDDPFVQQVFVALYVVGVVLLAAGPPLTRATLRWIGVLGAFVGVVGLSTVWSHDRTRTLSQAVLLALTSAFGVYLGSRFDARRFARTLFAALHLGTAIAAFAVARSWVGSRDSNGVWTGIYFNRNSLGPVAVLGLLAAGWIAVDGGSDLVAGRARDRSTLVWVSGALLAALLDLRVAAGARSVTPLLGLTAAVGACGAAVLLALLVRRGRLTVRRADRSFAVASFASALVVLFGWRRFSTAIGRSPTLESRTGLWGLVVDTWKERPLQGHGWLSVWTDPAYQRKVVAVANVPLPAAHNGYLEVLLGTGVLGAVAFAAVLVLVLRRVWRVDAVLADRTATWPMALVAYALTVNLMETFVGANLLVWVLLVAAGTWAGGQRLSAASPARPAHGIAGTAARKGA